jgi:GTP cyclohydrolase I
MKSKPKKSIDTKRIANAVKEILLAIGEDVGPESYAHTGR